MSTTSIPAPMPPRNMPPTLEQFTTFLNSVSDVKFITLTNMEGRNVTINIEQIRSVVFDAGMHGRLVIHHGPEAVLLIPGSPS